MEPSDRNDDLVPVLETNDELLISATRSALEGAGIPFVVQGEEASGLLPVAAVLLVPREKVELARELIAELDPAAGGGTATA